MIVKEFYQGESTVIEVKGQVTTFEIYDKFLISLNKYMVRGLKLLKEYRKPPIISLEKANWIDAHALPLLLAIGTFLKRYYGVNCEIIIPYNPRVVNYLSTANFLNYVGPDEKYTFYNDRECVGIGMSYSKSMNPGFIVDKLGPVENFYDLPVLQQNELKYRTSDNLKKNIVPRLTKDVLPQHKENVRDNKVDGFIFENLDKIYQSIAEVMCNATLYTDEDSYICIQKLSSKAFSPGAYISISDSGRGFKESLKLRPVESVEMVKLLESDTRNKVLKNIKLFEKLEDFFAMFEAFYTSAENSRFNLWTLITLVISSSGMIRIHNNKTQLVFNLNQTCFNCKLEKGDIQRRFLCGKSKTILGELSSDQKKEEVLKCMHCMLHNYISDKRISSLRLFDAKLQGVHIEIDFPVTEV